MALRRAHTKKKKKPRKTIVQKKAYSTTTP